MKWSPTFERSTKKKKINDDDNNNNEFKFNGVVPIQWSESEENVRISFIFIFNLKFSLCEIISENVYMSRARVYRLHSTLDVDTALCSFIREKCTQIFCSTKIMQINGQVRAYGMYIQNQHPALESDNQFLQLKCHPFCFTCRRRSSHLMQTSDSVTFNFGIFIWLEIFRFDLSTDFVLTDDNVRRARILWS